MNFSRCFFAIVFVFSFSRFAVAQDDVNKSDFYVGFQSGYASMIGGGETSTLGDRNEDNDMSGFSYGGVAGFKINNHISTEVFWRHLPDANDSADNENIKQWNAGVSFLVGEEYSDWLNPYIKVGVGWVQATSNNTTNAGREERAVVSFNPGLGNRFNLSDNLFIRTEYELFNSSEKEISHMFSAIFGYQF